LKEAFKTFHLYQCGFETTGAGERGDMIFAIMVRIFAKVSPKEIVEANKHLSDCSKYETNYSMMYSLVGHPHNETDRALPVIAKGICEHMKAKGYFDSQEWVRMVFCCL
jgi:hypothetical protein